MAYFSCSGTDGSNKLYRKSVIGMLLFYGIGLGLGAGVGLVETELIAFGTFLFQTVFSICWLSAFRFGPLEWGWRIITYEKWLSLRK